VRRSFADGRLAGLRGTRDSVRLVEVSWMEAPAKEEERECRVAGCALEVETLHNQMAKWFRVLAAHLLDSQRRLHDLDCEEAFFLPQKIEREHFEQDASKTPHIRSFAIAF